MRTICADCVHYDSRRQGLSPLFTPSHQHEPVCRHPNGRDLVTGEATLCRNRNNGSCPDYCPNYGREVAP